MIYTLIANGRQVFRGKITLALAIHRAFWAHGIETTLERIEG